MIPTELKTFVPDWMTELLTDRGSLSNTSKAYSLVPLVYRAFRIRCNSLASVPIHIYNDRGDLVEWPFPTPIQSIVWDMEASQLMRGAAFVIYNQGSLTGKRRDLQVLNPHAVTVNGDILPPTFTYQGLQYQHTYSYDEMLYLREYNPDDDIQPGAGAVQVALNDARLLYYLSRFPEAYFSSGAMPVTILGVKTNQSSEVEKVENWFKKRMQGIANAFGILGVKADTVTAQTLTANLGDMATADLKTQARQGVADAFELSEDYLSNTANYATAVQKDEALWEQVIKPRAYRIQASLNDFLDVMNTRIEFAFEEMSVFQEDESSRASSLNTLVQAGIPLILAMEILGYDLTDEQRTKIEALDQPAEAQPVPPEVPVPPAPDQQQTAAQMIQSNKSLKDALHNWKFLSLEAIKNNDPMPVDFDDPIIPDDMARFIRYEIETCADDKEVHRIFKKAREDYKTADLAEEIRSARLLMERLNP